MPFIFSPPPVRERIIMMHVCLSVRMHISETIVQTLPKFLCMLSIAVAGSSSSGVAICFILPVLWMTLCLHIMARNKRREKGLEGSWTT